MAQYNEETGEGSVAVEFGGSAVSSGSSYGKLTPEGYTARASALVKGNKNLQYADGDKRGYFEIEFKVNSFEARERSSIISVD